MKNIIDDFFEAYRFAYSDRMRSVYNSNTAPEMMASPVGKDGWFTWKTMPGTLVVQDYNKLETEFKINYPESFISWHKAYFFLDGDCSILKLPSSNQLQPLQQLRGNLDWYIAEKLIPYGLVPFAEEGNDAGSFVFDTRDSKVGNRYPIRVYDHEFGGDLIGLSAIVFSSFDRLLMCITHYLNNSKTKKDFEIIPDFFEIDPEGAGLTGRTYWTEWIEMLKANFEEFGY